MPSKAAAAFARALWRQFVGNPDQLLRSRILNVASLHQDVSSMLMGMQQLHTIPMGL